LENDEGIDEQVKILVVQARGCFNERALAEAMIERAIGAAPCLRSALARSDELIRAALR
jgi:hypothetical protein